jgi:hypothetical protein
MSESRETLLFAVEKAVGKDAPELGAFTSLLDRGEAGGLDGLLESVDESDYSLADWVEALTAFDVWLGEKGETRRPLAGMRGYIHCCTFTNSAQLSLPILKVIVIEALTEFGFDALSEPQY